MNLGIDCEIEIRITTGSQAIGARIMFRLQDDFDTTWMLATAKHHNDATLI